MNKSQPSTKPNLNYRPSISPMIQSQVYFGKDFHAIIEKQSKSNMFWNKRTITIKKVHAANADFSRYLPKASLLATSIVKVDIVPKGKKPNLVSIKFMVQDRIAPNRQEWAFQQQQLEQKLELTQSQQASVASSVTQISRDKKSVLTWEVSFINQDEMNEFVGIVKDVQNPPPPKQQPNDVKKKSIKQEDDLQDKLLALQKQKEEEYSRERELSRQEKEKKLKEEEELKQQQQNEQEKERQLQLQKQADEEKNKRDQEQLELLQKLQEERQEQERIRQEEIEREKERLKIEMEKLKYEWNFYFIKSLENYSKNLSDPKAYLEIHEKVKKMRIHATNICKTIIDELVLPNNLKTIKPTQSLHEYFSRGTLKLFAEGSPLLSDEVYIIDNLIIKLAASQMVQQKVYEETSLKGLGNEFRSLALLSDYLESKITEGSNFPLRVPLAIIVDWRGIRAFAMALPSWSQLVYGPNDELNAFATRADVNDLLFQMGNDLNLKRHTFTYGLQQVQIPLSLFFEVHAINQLEYLKIRNLDSALDKLEKPEDEPFNPSPHQLEIFFVQKTLEILPLYFDSTKTLKHLRPEFFTSYFRRVNPDAFLQDQPPEDQEELWGSVEYLTNQRISTLLLKLESTEASVTSSGELTNHFHKNGINMRFLGLVAQRTQQVFVKQLSETEMVSRVCKKVLRNNLIDIILQVKEDFQIIMLTGTEEIREGSYFKNLQGKENLTKEDALEVLDNLFLETTIDFLNLVLGSGKESDLFWLQILEPQIQYDYNYTFDSNQRELLPKGLLLQSILDKCNVKFDFSLQNVQNIFQKPNPLPITGFTFKTNVKSYQLNSSKITEISKRIIKIRKDHDESITDAIQMIDNLRQMQKNVDDFQSQGEEIDFDTFYQKIKSSNNQQDDSYPQYQLGKFNSYMVLIRQQLIQNNKDGAFELIEECVQLVRAHLTEEHPLLINIYSILGHDLELFNQLEDAYKAYITALMSSQKIFGKEHPFTAELLTSTAQVLLRLDKLQQSSLVCQEAQQIFKKAQETINPFYAKNEIVFAQILSQKGQTEEAYQSVLAALKVYELQEFENIEALIEAYIFTINLLTDGDKFNKLLFYCDKLTSLLERHNLTQEKPQVFVFVVQMALLAFAVSLNQESKAWLLGVSEEFNEIFEQQALEEMVGKDFDIQKALTQNVGRIMDALMFSDFVNFSHFLEKTLLDVLNAQSYSQESVPADEMKKEDQLKFSKALYTQQVYKIFLKS